MRAEYEVRAYDGYAEYDEDRYDKYDRAAMSTTAKKHTFAERFFKSGALAREHAKAGAINGDFTSSSGSLNSKGSSKVPQVQNLERAYLGHVVHSGSNVDGFVDVIDAATVENEAYNRVMFDELADGYTDFEGEERRRADFADAHVHEVDDLVEEEREHVVAGIDADFDAESSGRGEVDDAGSRSDSGDGTSDDDRSGGGTGDDYDDGPSDGYDDGDVGGDSGGYSPGERTPEGRGGYDSG